MIPVFKPWLGEEEAQETRRVILSGWVTQGPEVAAFEKEFATFVGASYACAVSSCTSALHLALKVLGVGEGDEVVTVSHSFIATANAVRYTGALPVFVDVEPKTGNMDPALLAAAISPRCKAVLAVHQLGMPCDMAEILRAVGGRVPVVEDAACAVGSEVLWRGAWERVGKPHGDLACFSFHPRKLLTTGDGGMITARDEMLDAELRRLRQHGMSVTDRERHSASRTIFETYEKLGYNYRLTDIQAAVGRVQLRRLPEAVAHRRKQSRRYRDMLDGLSNLTLPVEPDWAKTNWQSFCVKLSDDIDQRAMMDALLARGISTRHGVMCTHRENAYPLGSYSSAGALAHSEAWQDHGLILPLYHSMDEETQSNVVAALKTLLASPP